MKKNTVCLYFGLLVTSLQAATFTWNGAGTDNNWQTDANWNGGSKPSSDGSAALAFSGGTRTAAANNFDADTGFAGINLLNDASSGKTAAFTLSGNRVTLGGNIVSTTSSAAITDTLSLPLLLNGTRTFTQNNNHHLAISGVIGETGGSYGLIKSGGGNLTLNGANTYTGPTVMSGSGQVNFNSIKNIGEGASSFGAPTTVESGTITNSARLSYTGGTAATDRPIFITSGFNWDVSNSGTTLTLNGNIKGAAAPLFRGGGNFVINGVLDVGSAGVTRTDFGTVYLNCPTNPFTGNIQISAGAFSISNIADSGVACAIGKGNSIQLGQDGWYTTGKLLFTGSAGGSCNRAIRVETSTNTLAYGGIIENAVAGQTLLLSGNVSPATASAIRNPRLQLVGAGNGELSGVISGSIIIDKNSGAGTWTLSGANTYTGTTAVSAGTLRVNGSTHANSAVSVASGGTLGGTGTVYGAVSVAAGGTLAPGVGGLGTLTLARAGSAALTHNGGTLAFELGAAAGSCDRLDVASELVLNGANTVAPDVGTAPAGAYTLMTYASRSGLGTLTLNSADPRYRLTVGDTNVVLTIGGSTLVWKGDASANAWDTTTANWLDGTTPATYADGLAVIFDNAGSASPAIAITPDAVAPFSVTVNADSNAYTIGGGAITGACDLTKSGTNRLTITGANAYGGATFVNAGTLVLNGSLSNSSVTVANNATFTQSAGSALAGTSASFNTYGTATLAGTNTYGGVTVVGVLGTPNITLTVNNGRALGSTASGTVVNGGNAGTENRLILGSGVTVSNETLTLNTGTTTCRAGLHYTQYSGSATWAGDIVLTGTSYAYLTGDNNGGTLIVGASSAHTITGAVATLSMRGIGNVTVNSRLDIGTTSINRDDPGTWTLNSASNVWLDTNISQGTLKLGVTDALPTGTALTIGKSGNTADAIVDLNGMDQRVAGLADVHYAAGNGTQRILSAAPATLTVSNSAARTFGLAGSTIEGNVSLKKLGTATLTLTGTNSYSGATVVSNGTLAVSATGTLGTNSLAVTVGGSGTLVLSNAVAIADEATVQMPEAGVATAKLQLEAGEETVGWLLYGDVFKKVGTYGATGSGANYTDDTHFAGSGRLRVLHSKSGLLILVQ